MFVRMFVLLDILTWDLASDLSILPMHKLLYLITLVIIGVVGSVIVSSAYAEQKRAYSAGAEVSGVKSGQEADKCVESIPIMRREHMDFLFHQRDSTMYHGIRTKRYSLKGCVECHVRKDDQGYVVPVDAPEQFCQNCHRYVAINIDCFQCHAAMPDVER
uniref:Uncharacterized protein n=1 Tax=Candidatus Kentrum sp. TUN TaxID=2126343 RepID=A0A450ZAM7_9GAMM|nr:MAG: hypothetical protein BECKTUN1418E_GA0071001_100136 [Candidatus Kentron sp. TUN]VFK50829.1 MAG: hypothetical protein BECKTUN1418D_GA0071000_100227 [Candidatus Kentron sp. TUN]VFK51240.1 MAG: hypothetical protein BECKTUN1418F_GA0071002_100136 [Candidatus Kentron sp. TUN]